MSLPLYPSYRESGVRWMGPVPAGWTVLSLSRTTTAKCDGPFGSSLKSEHYSDEGVRVVRLQNIRAGLFDGSDAAFISAEYAASLGDHDIRAGDVLIAGLGDDRNVVGRACVASAEIGPAMVKADCFRFRIDQERALPKFLAWQLSAGAESDAGVLSTGSTRSRIPLSTMATRRICLPPLAEQTSICNFLDRETAKIDALAEEQQRLIELLKEKRQAVISHAVTKGLDPHAPMRDSGVEWLGDVPAHWSVTTLKHFWSVADCKHITPEFVADGPALASIREVQSRFVNLSEAKRTTPAFLDQMNEGGREPRAGDLIFSRNASVGEVAEVADWHPPFAMGQDVCLLRKRAPASSTSFLYYMIKSRIVVEQLANVMVGATFKRVNIEDVRNLIITIPPAGEQAEIAISLEQSEARMAELINEAEQAIRLFQERRAALISAAVTGKIDVRGVGDAESAAEAA